MKWVRVILAANGNLVVIGPRQARHYGIPKA
jgi:hypothetical protein